MPVTPDGYLRKVLARDEAVLYTVRQHPLFLWGRIIGAVIFAILILAAVWALRYYVIDSPQLAWGYLLALLAAPTIWWRVLVWRNHQFVVTSRRVMQLSGVFTKTVIDSLLEKVNDLKTDQSLFGRMFGYGDIEILTASEAGINDFRHIANPLEFKRAILEAKEQLERGAGAS
jgi:uncharacterized membrane protein YdbT with pleckstrin-like domain